MRCLHPPPMLFGLALRRALTPSPIPRVAFDCTKNTIGLGSVIAVAPVRKAQLTFGGPMAKRQRLENVTAAEHKIEEFPEDLGHLLGTARSKAEGWLGQRKQIVDHLEGIRDT